MKPSTPNTRLPPSRSWRVALLACLAVVTVVFILGARTMYHGGTKGDFPIYYRAAVATAHGQPLDDAAAQGYLCPPLCSAVMSPVGLLTQGQAAVAWVLASLALLAITLWVSARDAMARWLLPRGWPQTALVVLGATLLSFDRIRDELSGGQVDGLLLAGFAFGLAWLDSHPILAGIAIGFGANIKYTALILLPYLVLRRRWLAAASAAVSTVGFALAPALITGWETNLRNLSVAFGGLLDLLGVRPAGTAIAMPPLEYSRSVSLTSAASRVLPEAWGRPAVYACVAGVAGAIFLACAAVYRRMGMPLWARPRAETPDARAVTSLEWCALVAVVLLFSPQTQVRHMILLLVPHVIAIALLLRRPRYRGVLIAGLVIEQAGMMLPPGRSFGEGVLEASRLVGWPSWCLAVFLLTLLWTGLDECRRMARPETG